MPSRNSPKRYELTKTPVHFEVKVWPEDTEVNSGEVIEFQNVDNANMGFMGEVLDVVSSCSPYTYEVMVDNLVPRGSREKPLSVWHVYRRGDVWVGKHIKDMDFDD
ncbi:hypothetical protein LLE49_24750 [Alicyclobacillus tolerans]|uniref:hypothetical protein n=1 Tax=Alicyclobacillus tolerans TaxID=90970 RepID=UPI001F3EC69E|nr:hypothetical protein [Alicyclobacillus tolerans]MCF8567937.1 hypothetical protein [Alicyclobacillus tolerans]